jgi:hypothetical protein
MDEHRNYLTSDGSLLYRVSVRSLKRVARYTECPFVVVCMLGFIMDQGLKIIVVIVKEIFVKISRIEFEENYTNALGTDTRP